ncbi:MAG: NeuD/PglB/VioB family sugar acetyltransferase [Actinomycetes bacterium]
MERGLVLVAASGLAREVLSVCDALGRRVDAILDDHPGKQGTTVAGVRVFGPVESVTSFPDAEVLICAGKGTSRRAIAARLAAQGLEERRYATLVDPTVRIPRSCTVGVGTILLAGVVLTADVTIGRHAVCMPHVTLTHDVVLEDYATLTAGVSLAGGVRVGEAAYVGMNASAREGVTIGAEAILGMGAALIGDQPGGSVYTGVPARPRKGR